LNTNCLNLGRIINKEEYSQIKNSNTKIIEQIETIMKNSK